MVALNWLGFRPKTSSIETDAPAGSPYLITGGAEILATDATRAEPLQLESGSRLALLGTDTFRKHYFCDWLLGYVDVPGSSVTICVGSQTVENLGDRTRLAGLLGRSPFLYGDTIQESLLYRTQNVRKQDLFHLVERFYGAGLRSRTSPENPFCDSKGKPVPTQVLNAREHLEIAQINILLQKTPIVVLDLSSDLMTQALELGYRPCAELFESGKTLIAILPPGKDLAWATEITGQRFSSQMQFE